MNEFTLGDGVVVTVVAMGTVFAILAALWGLMELVRILVARSEPSRGAVEVGQVESPTSLAQQNKGYVTGDEERQMVAVLSALIEAHQDNPGRKYEVVEVERVK